MKGSAFKSGGVQGTSEHASALKQVVHSEGIGKEGFVHDVEANYQPMSKTQAEQARYAMLDTKGKGDNTRYGDRHIPGRAQWIREKFGRSLTKRQRRKAEIAFYKAHPPTKTTYEAEGEAPAVNTTEAEVAEVNNKPEETVDATEIPATNFGYFDTEFSQKGKVPKKEYRAKTRIE